MSTSKDVRPWAAILCFMMAGAVGCAAPLTTTSDAFTRLSQTVHERSGQDVRWEQGTHEEVDTAARVAELVRSRLTEEEATQLALLNSSALQAQFERLAVAHGEQVTKTTLQNPFVTLLARFPFGGGVSFGEFNFVQNLLDLFLLPWRRDQANINMERARLEVTQIVLDTIREVRVAYYQLQAAEQVAALRRKMLSEVQRASELAEIRSKSRQIDDIDIALGRATYQQLKLDLAKNELQAVLMREKLVELLGLERSSVTWQVVPLKALPLLEVPLTGLEDLALQQRLDIASSQAHAQLFAEALHLTESSTFVGSVLVGGATTRDSTGTQLAGPTLVVELPIFNRRQGHIESLRATLRQAQSQAKHLRISVLSQVRRAQQAVLASRAVVEPFADALIPLRRRITEITARKVERGDKGSGAWDVVLARQEELKTQCEWVEAICAYWSARADLEHAVGADLVE